MVDSLDPSAQAAPGHDAQRSHEEIQALLRQEIAQLQGQLEDRFREIAVLTKMMEEERQAQEQARQDLSRALEQQQQAHQQALTEQAVRLERQFTVRALLRQAVEHMAQHGPAEGVAGPEQQTLALSDSALFDADWYLQANPDVAEAELDPLEHYLTTGAFEGRDPGPAFSTMDYYMANPDVAGAGWVALSHYVMYGQAENRPLSLDSSLT